MRKITKAVIPAAGHGTRFLPVTKAVPKEMLAIIDKPAVHYIAQEAADSGITDILFVVSRDKAAIKNYFSAGGAGGDELDELLRRVRVDFAYQDEATGTAGAVKLAREFTGDDAFAVMYGDDVIVNEGGKPCVAQLAEVYYNTGKPVLGVQERPEEEATKYAVIKKGRTEGRCTEVLGIAEKPAIGNMASNLCSLGRYLLTPAVYDAIERAPLFRGERYLTHAIELMIPEGVYAYDFEGTRYDLGDKFGFLQANVEEGLRRYGDKLASYLRGLLSDGSDGKTER